MMAATKKTQSISFGRESVLHCRWVIERAIDITYESEKRSQVAVLQWIDSGQSVSKACAIAREPSTTHSLKRRQRAIINRTGHPVFLLDNMPIPGTKGQGEIILKYMKTDYDDSYRDVEERCENEIDGKEDMDPAFRAAYKELYRLVLGWKNTDGTEESSAEAPFVELLNQYPRLAQLEVGRNGRLALHIAAIKQFSLQTLESLVLLYPKALMKQDKQGFTPLGLACYFNHCDPAILRLLACPEAVAFRDQYDDTVLHEYLNTKGQYEVDFQVLRQFVQTCPENLKVRNNSGRLPLHVAVDCIDHIDFPIIPFLVESYSDAIKIKDNKGATPLHLLCGDNPFDNAHVVQLLIGACPEAAKITNCNGRTALHLVCTHSEHDLLPMIVRLLLATYPKSASVLDHEFKTPLHLYLHRATTFQDIPLISRLVKAYPQALCMKDCMDCTPLHEATKRSTSHIIRFLKEQSSEPLEPYFDGGIGSPLHTLCASYDIGKLREFLKSLDALVISERAVRARDYGGRTPAHLLARAGGLTRDALRIISAKYPGILLERDVRGRFPLHSAIEGSIGCESSIEESARYHDTIQCLLGAFSAAVSAGDKYGMTPLQYACENDASLSIVYQLVSDNPIANLGLESGRPVAMCGKKRKAEEP